MSGSNRIAISCVFIVLVCVGSTFANERVVNHIMSSTGCSRGEAILIERGLNEFIGEFELRLKFIAESHAPIDTKEERSKEIIKRFFASNKSMVWVSSLTTGRKTWYYADEYLNHLSHLSEKYTRVTFYFDPMYLGVGKIHRDTDNARAYEVSLTVKQIFIGRNEEYTYADDTTKQLWVQFRFEGQKLRFVIQAVTLSETVPRPEMTLDTR